MARNRTVNPKLNLRLNLHGLTTLPLMAYPVAVHATHLAPFNLGGSVGNPNRTPLVLTIARLGFSLPLSGLLCRRSGPVWVSR